MVGKFNKKMKWLILGGSGQLGTELQFKLRSEGQDFLAPSKDELNIENPKRIREYLILKEPEIVVNAAAWTNVELAEGHSDKVKLLNTDSAIKIFEVCSQLQCKFFQISTDYVFSGSRDTPWLENDEMRPISVYGNSKAAAELHILNNLTENSIILRTSWLYSPWRNNFVKTIIKKAINNSESISVVSDTFGQPTSATDLAKQIYIMGNSRINSGVYHGTNSGVSTWFEFAAKIFTLGGFNTERLIPITSNNINSKAKRPKYSVLSHQNWKRNNIDPMRDWEIALKEAFPKILDQVIAENSTSNDEFK